MSEKSEPQAPAKPMWTKPRLELIVNLTDAEAGKITNSPETVENEFGPAS